MMGTAQRVLSRSSLWQNVCSHCQLLHKALPPLWVSARGSKNWKKKIDKREDIKDTVVEYVGQNPRRADRVYAWGCATTGALGIASYLRPEQKQKPIRRQLRPARVKFIDANHIRPYFVSCGYGFTVYAVKSSRGLEIFGTGMNTNSQLGYHEVPRNSGRVLDYIIEPVEIYLPVEKPHATRVRHIGCGRAHTVIITEGAGVFSLGNNAYGQCGRPIVEGENFSKSPLVNTVHDLPDNVEKVVCGQDHTIFITQSGQLLACGMGADGQTGQGHYDLISTPTHLGGDVEGEKIVQVHGRGDCVLAVSDKGDVFGWGNSEYSQLALVTDHTQMSTPRHLPFDTCGRVVKAVAGGSICALLNDKGQVFVWGYGILGKGPALESSNVPTMIPETLFGRNELQADSKVVDIDCGLGHFVAVTDQGDVYSWGHNRHGCLGLGSSDNQFFPLKVSVPAETHTALCGVDHTIALCKSFT
ncbi:RCC1-like G exchanging factor-like protein [Littorina saxatilis]|uniref:RCC1-like G exchanging factor-like protein n=1 Tax=Littorina saxatilis TaxID=31220 RepID=UPI0038B4D9B5